MLSRLNGQTFYEPVIFLMMLQLCIVYTNAQIDSNASTWNTDTIKSTTIATADGSTISQTDSTTAVPISNATIYTANITTIAVIGNTSTATTESTTIFTADSANTLSGINTVIVTTDKATISSIDNTTVVTKGNATITTNGITTITTVGNIATNDITTITTVGNIATSTPNHIPSTTTANTGNIIYTTNSSRMTSTIYYGDITGGTSTFSESTNIYTTYASPIHTSSRTDQTSTRSTDRPKVPPSYPVPKENLEIPILLQLKCEDCVFDDSKENHRVTEEYFRTHLELAFNETRGFKNITIIGFWKENASIIFMTFFKNVPPRQLKNELFNGAYNKLLASEVAFNRTFLAEKFQNDVNTALNRICMKGLSTCPKDFKCILHDQVEPWCEHLCSTNESQSMCQHGGYCVVDTEYKAVCRCTEDSNFLYGGEKCEIKAERLTLQKEHIIAIAAGVGGGIILILVITIIIICLRNRLKNRQQKENVLDNVSEQSYMSFRGSEDDTRQPVASSSSNDTLGVGRLIFRLSEERAENPRFNPYLSQPNQQLSATNLPVINTESTSDNHRKGKRQSELIRERSRTESKQFQDTVPNYGEPAQLPHLEHASSARDNVKIEDEQSRVYHSFVHQPTRVMWPLKEFRHENHQSSPAEVKVYDYSHNSETTTIDFSHPLHNDTNLYDFEYENSGPQGRRVADPYSMKSPLVSSQPYF